MRSNISSTARRLVVAGRAAAPRRCRARGHAACLEPAAGLGAGRRELVSLADRLEVLLRDLEQHAAEVVRDERGDRGQQRAERVDEPLGLLVVGEVGESRSGSRTCSSNSATACSAIVVRRGVVVARASASRSVSGKPGLEQPQTRARRRRRRPRCSARAPSCAAGHEQPFARDGFEQRAAGRPSARRARRA